MPIRKARKKVSPKSLKTKANGAKKLVQKKVYDIEKHYKHYDTNLSVEKNFSIYLSQFRLTSNSDTDLPITHTCMKHGKYHIPDDELLFFMQFYQAAIEDRGPGYIHLTEVHLETHAPILIDLDFMFDLNEEDETQLKREYTRKLVEHVIKIYTTEIHKALNIKEDDPRLVAFFFYRPRPYIKLVSDPYKKTKSKVNVKKDGIHIIYPFICAEYDIIHYLRKRVMEQCYTDDVFDHLPLITEREIGKNKEITVSGKISMGGIHDIVDESVLQTNNWLLMGSCKVGRDTYQVDQQAYSGTSMTRIGMLNLMKWDGYTEKNCFAMFSIRLRDKSHIISKREDNNDLLQYLNRVRQKVIKRIEKAQNEVDKGSQLVDPFEKEHSSLVQTVVNRPQIMNNQTTFADGSTEGITLGIIKTVVNNLSIERADKYSLWINVGLCLYNIHIDLLPVWEDFSQRSGKYKPGECKKLWYHSFKDRGNMDFNTLKSWLRIDNIGVYKKMFRSRLNEAVLEALDGDVHSMARVMGQMYQNQFVCSDYKKNVWWYYNVKLHRWMETDSGMELRKKISGELFDILVSKRSTQENEHGEESNTFYNDDSDSSDSEDSSSDSDSDDDDEAYRKKRKSKNTKKAKKKKAIKSKGRIRESVGQPDTKKLRSKLHDTAFKDKLMRECKEVFYVRDFESKLDTNKNLIGFNNGVFDLSTMKFRPGDEYDYITLSTGWQYEEINPNDPFWSKPIKECEDMLHKIFLDMSVYEFVMTYVLAKCLSGEIRFEKLFLWIGDGGNGKGLISDLMRATLGDYATTIPITLFTGKRAGAESAQPQLIGIKGRRFVVLNEPEVNCCLNTGLVKELTGGDPIKVRNMYSLPIEFKPQSSMNIFSNYYLGLPDGDDGGMKRRLISIPCKSKFCDNPNPDNPFEFQADPGLKERIADMKHAFFYLLCKYHVQYKKADKFEAPELVKKETENYFRSYNMFQNFLDDCTMPVTEQTVPPTKYVTLPDLYDRFKVWFTEEGLNGSKPDKNKLKEYLHKRRIDPRKVQGNRVLAYTNMTLKLEGEENNY